MKHNLFKLDISNVKPLRFEQKHLLVSLTVIVVSVIGARVALALCGYDAGPRCTYSGIPCSGTGGGCSKTCIDNSNWGFGQCVSGQSEDGCLNFSDQQLSTTTSFGECVDGACNYTSQESGLTTAWFSENVSPCY